MNAIFKVSLKFTDPEKVQKPIIIHPSGTPVEVPAWISKTPTYLVNLSAGNIIEINPKDAEKVTISKSEQEGFAKLKADYAEIKEDLEDAEKDNENLRGVIQNLRQQLSAETEKLQAAEAKILALQAVIDSTPPSAGEAGETGEASKSEASEEEVTGKKSKASKSK